jgi:hypothetical protein
MTIADKIIKREKDGKIKTKKTRYNQYFTAGSKAQIALCTATARRSHIRIVTNIGQQCFGATNRTRTFCLQFQTIHVED